MAFPPEFFVCLSQENKLPSPRGTCRYPELCHEAAPVQSPTESLGLLNLQSQCSLLHFFLDSWNVIILNLGAVSVPFWAVGNKTSEYSQKGLGCATDLVYQSQAEFSLKLNYDALILHST